MPVIINLHVMMAKRRMGIVELSRKTGMHYSNVSHLKNGRVKTIRLSAIEAICRVLDCKPGDLFDYIAPD